jgi:hypothetical protein
VTVLWSHAGDSGTEVIWLRRDVHPESCW